MPVLEKGELLRGGRLQATGSSNTKTCSLYPPRVHAFRKTAIGESSQYRPCSPAHRVEAAGDSERSS
jgi:hypothetical protein